jgi:hypothetical protein
MYAGCSSIIPTLPNWVSAAMVDRVRFDPARYHRNKPQTIMVFLYGGASELAGNFTNYSQFKNRSQTNYSNYFGRNNVRQTARGFWGAAGGDIMEELLSGGSLAVFRTCFSQVRWNANNRSHGPCVAQNPRSSFNEDGAGVFSNLARILWDNDIVDARTKMPFMTMEGDSGFYARGDLSMISAIEPIAINENLDNPFDRGWERDYGPQMDSLAQAWNRAHNFSSKITDAFAKRREMETFIDRIDALPDPSLGTNAHGESLNYDDNGFARKLKTAIKIMNYNPDTRVISLGTAGLGGWDDHNDADNYLDRMRRLFRGLRSAAAHLKQVGKLGTINIMVMGDFGRGVNLNSAKGWDHGNLQTFYVVGGKDYFHVPRLLGQTVVDTSGSANRLYLKPKPGTYWFEPISVASTLYSIYGVTNPGVLTDNRPVITPLMRS